jgi:phage terminase large subunit
LEAAKSHRIIINYGGSSSSKTISVLQLLTQLAFYKPSMRFTLVAESVPVIKKTILADWRDLVMPGLWERHRFNKTDMVYTFSNGSTFSFVPADDDSRFHGPRQDYLMLDEAFNIKKKIFDQAEVRTRKKIFITFNPTSVFWAKELFDLDETAVIHSTYIDNPYVEQTVIDSLERRAKTDENFYNVYTRGEWGSLEGLIFKEGIHWQRTTQFPDDYKKRIYGLDFGFSMDPAAVCDIRYSDGQIWVRELLYQKEMLNSQLAKYLDYDTVADSAEPKSIQELRLLGKRVWPSVKGADSINQGINLMKEFKINVTTDSVNLIKELRNYSWKKDRDDNQLSKPVDDHNHLIDALRYGVVHLFLKKPGYTSY